MVKGFYEDLSKARKAENIVLKILNNSTIDYDFEDVGDKKEFFHKGDIKIIGRRMNYFLDVKDDSRVAETGNILAEHRVWFKNGGWKEGFMQIAEYDFVGYLSQQDNMLYILDFALWKKYYKNYYKRHLNIPHDGEQITDGYLMALSEARQLGIVIAEIKYDNECCPINIKVN